MANQITLNASLAYEDNDGSEVDTPQIVGLIATLANIQFVRHKQSIGFAAEEAIVLGEVTDPGWAIFVNRDVTHYIELRVATGGAVFAKLLPGEFAMLRLGAGAQAPYAIANVAACRLDYFIART